MKGLNYRNAVKAGIGFIDLAHDDIDEDAYSVILVRTPSGSEIKIMPAGIEPLYVYDHLSDLFHAVYKNNDAEDVAKRINRGLVTVPIPVDKAYTRRLSEILSVKFSIGGFEF